MPPARDAGRQPILTLSFMGAAGALLCLHQALQTEGQLAHEREPVVVGNRYQLGYRVLGDKLRQLLAQLTHVGQKVAPHEDGLGRNADGMTWLPAPNLPNARMRPRTLTEPVARPNTKI